MGRLKIEVKLQQRLPPYMVNNCHENLCLRAKGVTKKYIQQLDLIYIARNSIYVDIHVHVLYEVEMQAHEVYEIYNENIIHFAGVLDIYLRHPPAATRLR
jgi:hypothetical protein